MPAYSSANRPVRLRTPLGEDTLHPFELRGEEGLSELFRFHVHVRLTDEKGLSFEDLLGKTVRLEVELPDCPIRYICGLVAEITALGRDAGGWTYALLIVPRLWTRSLGRNYRICQQQSVPQILQGVLRGNDVRFDLEGEYPVHNICVQYDESDFAFISRLMEEEGIHYFFEHTAEGDRLVISDRSPNAPRIQPEISFGAPGSGERKTGTIRDWQKTQRLTIQQSVLADFCFQRSNLVLTATAQVPGSVTVGSVTHRLENPVGAIDVHFPGEFVHRVDGVSPSGSGQPECLDRLGVDGDRTARLRMERNAVMAFDLQGTSGCSHLTPGYRFTLTKHHDGDGDYLVARVCHLLTSSDLRGGSPNEWSYENQFSALPASLPYRPPRSTPKARVRGTQTAIVVGSGDDPIRTDRYGRVKVRFHWDVRGADNADSSAWVRVAQSWAGNRWGMLNIPRAGQEVVVDFLDSDPDCPIIVGSVYNEKNPPPFDLPAQKTLSGFKSDSQLSDEPDAFSGLAVEDRDGSEELHLRSQKDMIVNVKNNHLTSIHGQNVEHTGSVRLTTLGGFAPPGIGSGSGGGESGNKFEDAAGWGYGMVKDHLGQSYATTIGIEAQKGIGQNTIAIYGGEQSLVVDPLAWINEFTCVPVNPKLAMAVGVAMGTGRQTVTYGKLVDMSYGARMQVARGPYYAYAGPMTSGAKFPSRTFVGLRPLPTVLAFVAEALVTEFKGKNVDVIVGLNAGALVTQGLLGWWCGKADRVYLRTLESTLKLGDGLSTTLSGYSDAPIRDTSETYALVRRIMATHISEAREDLTFQAGVTEDRAAHRQLIEGPYSVKASGAIEIATFDGVESGQARFNLQDDSALVAGSRVCSLVSGKSVLQLSPEGVNAFAGPNGTIKLCAGFRPDRIDSRTQVQIGPSNLSLAVGATPLPTRIGMIPGEIRLATGAATASRIIMDDDHVELKFGASSIRLDATGITLTGNLIRLDGQSGIQHRSPLTQIQ